MSESKPDSPQEIVAILDNRRRVASRGREPGLRLTKGAKVVTLAEWGHEVLAACEPVAAALDEALDPGNGIDVHRKALAAAAATLDDPSLTPSARVLETMARDHDNSYSRFVLAQSLRHRDAITGLPLSDDVAARFARLAEESRARQREIEAADTLPFEAFRQEYMDPRRLHV